MGCRKPKGVVEAGEAFTWMCRGMKLGKKLESSCLGLRLPGQGLEERTLKTRVKVVVVQRRDNRPVPT